MTTNPTLILILILVLKNQKQITPPQINILQIESFLDNAKEFLETIEKINSLSNNAMSVLPNMDNLLKLAEPLLSSLKEE